MRKTRGWRVLTRNEKSGNLIQYERQVEALKSLATLEELDLTSNPISNLKNFRLRIINLLPQVKVLNQVFVRVSVRLPLTLQAHHR